MGKQMWRYEALKTNTQLIREFCRKHGLTIQSLNSGYQLRINGVIDLYPVRKKWHYLPTNERGEWDDINDLDVDLIKTAEYRNMWNKNATKYDNVPMIRVPATGDVFAIRPEGAVLHEKDVKVPEHDTYRLERPRDKIAFWKWWRNPIKWYRMRKLTKHGARWRV